MNSKERQRLNAMLAQGGYARSVAEAIIAKYDPDQARDDHGRFASGAEAAAAGRFDVARAAHADAEAAHKDAAAGIRQEGGDKRLALKHEQAARAHETAKRKNEAAMYSLAARSRQAKSDAVRASTRADDLSSALTKS